jgi:glycosyltransferase involved in cell wall biosynthesis
MTRLSRVAYVCTDPGVPVFGSKGCSLHARSMLVELRRRAPEVHLFAARLGGPVPAGLEDVTVHLLPCPTGPTVERERALVEVDRELTGSLDRLRAVDLVYQRYSLWSCAAMELAAARGWPSALEINAPLVDEQARHRDLAHRSVAIERSVRSMRAATAPFGVSDSTAAWASDLSGRPVGSVPNGVDAGRFTGERSPGRSDERELVIGFVGSFRPWHDLPGVVRAVAEVAHLPSSPPVRLMLVGDGPGLGPAIDHASELGLAVTSTGSLAPEAVPEALASMDIGLAVYETGERYFSPLKVFEYLAAGLPVVASAVGGLEHLLRPDDGALLSRPGDGATLAQHLALLCARPDLRDRLGRAGRRAAIERFSWSKVLDRVLHLLPADRSAA